MTIHKIRFVTAASLFDGHDVSINIMRRMLQASGAEVIHLGHNRSVHEIVTTALQEDVHGIAISSYQGGHVEFFKYIIDQLKQYGLEHIKVFGGGGGVITSSEIKTLEAYGVERIYSPHDGQTMGLQGIIDDMMQRCDFDICQTVPASINQSDYANLAKIISAIQEDKLSDGLKKQLDADSDNTTPVIGLTGTGGAGKSSLTDELVQRLRLDNDEIKIAILAIDPSKRKTGGALLGDRIRMNSIDSPTIFMRSLATRSTSHELIPNLNQVINACKLTNFDLIIIETPGIGQGDAGLVPFVDLSIYAMTPEFGATSQLEKIDMLDFADIVVINKFDRKGALDAIRDVRKQMQRNKKCFDTAPEDMPVYGTIAARFNDPGVTAFYQELLTCLNQNNFGNWQTKLAKPTSNFTEDVATIVPTKRQRYLAEISETVRRYHQTAQQQADIAANLQHLTHTQALLTKTDLQELTDLIDQESKKLLPENQALLQQWPSLKKQYKQTTFSFKVRDKEIKIDQYTTSLSGLAIPKIALPNFTSHKELLTWLLKENLPGYFPYTAGLFPFKRTGELPGRMFAGEGDAFKTNKRFKYLSKDSDAKRLSTAFDSVTLYGFDPNIRPDIYGKIGNSGVAIATVADMQVLFDSFDLCAPNTSVSMTINGPAPTILAMFLNAAINQKINDYQAQHQQAPDKNQTAAIKAQVLKSVRGTVQADILKEDQAQNTCIFSTEFSLKMMADIQEYFVQHDVNNFYSVSISGYHIAEAGANPISQLAFTLANGFTYVEAYLARGMHIDDFAPNLSFFFSNAMDPEFSVMGRVARRIWAITLRDKYGANERSQKLKYHIQTSGRSLHAQEMAFNDIRTTLEALIALYDNCNSLHTNAYNEALTTPTEESVRRAQAIQLIINKEWGLSKNENPLQGTFIIEELTDLVEEAVLCEFDRINDRGGVLGAMETGYQRSKIQEESLHYESLKHDGSLPIIGVNTFINPHEDHEKQDIELARSTEAEKQSQLTRLEDFHQQHADQSQAALNALQQAVIDNQNVFAVLMETVKVCSLGQITDTLFKVGGKYRRNM